MSGRLEAKVCVITGAGSGIGRASALLFAREGGCIVVADVDRAVGAAGAAIEGAWGRLAAAERGRLLARFSATIATHAERLAQIESQDTGKPISQARARASAGIRWSVITARASLL